MGNSSLVNYTCISPNRTSPRNHIIDKITIHHMAGNLSVESCGNVFKPTSRKASSNYGVGTDGRIGLYVEEKDRSWCSSNADNDHRAITIEVANDGGADTNWHVSDKALQSLIELCVDICKRNNIKQLNFTGNKNGNLTMHKYFTATACPGPYLESKFPYIASEVNKRLAQKPILGITPTIIQSMGNDEIIYRFFINKGLTIEGVCGLLGNLYAESGLRPNNLQNSFEKKLNMTDDEYVKAVDANEHNFIKDSAGFGLAQWTFWSRKKALLEHKLKKGVSIADLNMQCEFLYNELTTGYRSVLNILTTTHSLKEASDIVLLQFEKPADQSENVKNKRYNYSMTYYNKFNINNNQLVCPFTVKVNTPKLNIRTGAGTNYNKIGRYTGIGVFTIIEVKQGAGSKKGWGKLKSGLGWISLDYCEY